MMNFGQLFTSFEGRIGRKEWWIGFILLYVIQFIVYFSAVAIGIIPADAGSTGAAGMAPGASLALLVILLIFLWPTLAIHAKRWHDRGKSGWWTLIALVPLIGGLWLLIELGFLRGDDAANRYGPNPVSG
jgi:uncharacterized membrane protein YhaH (DUF805 family)